VELNRKIREYIVAILAIAFFGHLFWSAFDNTSLGRARCEESCIAQGGVEFVWVPGTKKSRSKTGYASEVESKCSCFTEEDILKKKKEWEAMKEAIKKHKQKN
jgi:hypothetical protein